MKTTKEKLAWGILTAGFIGWLILVCISILQSCDTPKRTQKKDDQAVGRVLSKPELTAKVGNRIQRPPDTIRVPYRVEIHDTLPAEAGYSAEEYKRAVELAYQTGNQELYNFLESIVWFTNSPIKTTLPNGITVEIDKDGIRAHVVVTGTKDRIVDRAEIDRWKDSLSKYYLATIDVYKERDALKAENKQIRAELTALQKPPKKFPWWLIILGAIVVGILAILFRKQTWFIVLISKLFNMISKHKSFKASDTTTVTNTGIAHVAFPPPKPDGYINLFKVTGGWQFQIVAPNHEALATSEVYKTKQAAKKGIAALSAYKFDTIKEKNKYNAEDI